MISTGNHHLSGQPPSEDLWVQVRHEGAWKMRDRPLGAGLQELASNRLKLHWSRAIVVSVKEKVPQDGIR